MRGQGSDYVDTATAMAQHALFPGFLVRDARANIVMQQCEHVRVIRTGEAHKGGDWNVAISIVLKQLRDHRPAVPQSLSEYIGLGGQRNSVALSVTPHAMKALSHINRNGSPRVRIVGSLFLRTPAPERIKCKPPDVTVLLKCEVIKWVDVLLSRHQIIVICQVLAAENARSAEF